MYFKGEKKIVFYDLLIPIHVLGWSRNCVWTMLIE